VLDLVESVVHIGPTGQPAGQGRPVVVDQVTLGHGTLPSTADTALENSSQAVRCSTSAVRPSRVSWYVRRRRPSTSFHVLVSSLACCSRCSTGYSVPSGRSNASPL